MQFCGIKQNDMEKTLIQLIKAVASKLHNSKQIYLFFLYLYLNLA